MQNLLPFQRRTEEVGPDFWIRLSFFLFAPSFHPPKLAVLPILMACEPRFGLDWCLGVVGKKESKKGLLRGGKSRTEILIPVSHRIVRALRVGTNIRIQCALNVFQIRSARFTVGVARSHTCSNRALITSIHFLGNIAFSGPSQIYDLRSSLPHRGLVWYRSCRSDEGGRIRKVKLPQL